MIRARQLAGASIGLGAVTAWGALLGLVTTPYLISHLGAPRYGVFAVIAIMSAYLSNLEFGFGQATIRFLARAKAAADVEDQKAVLQTSFSLFLVAGSLAAAIALGGSSFIDRTFVHGSAALQPETLGAIRLGALILFASFLASFASSALVALARFQVILTTRAVFGTLASAGAVAVVAAGGGLQLVLGAQLVVTSVLCLVLLVALVRASGVALRPRVSSAMLRAMAAFGGLILVSGLAYQVMLQAPPTILAGYSTTAQVAAFAVPNLVFAQLASLAGATSLGFLPFVSASSVASDRTHLSEVYQANLRLTLLTVGPIAAFLACFARPLLTTWISARFALEAAVPLQFLGVAALVLSLSAAPADVARGLGRPRWVATYTVVAASCAVVAAFIVVPAHGAGGAAFALLFGLSVATLPFIFVVGFGMLHVAPLSIIRSLITPLVALACLAAFDAIGATISDGITWTLAIGVAGSCLYASGTFIVVLDPRERHALTHMIRRRGKVEAAGADVDADRVRMAS